MERQVREFFLALKALANPTRFFIARLLQDYERLKFEEIKKKAGIKHNPTLKYHLAKLQKASLVKNYRRVVTLKSGKRIVYSWYSLTRYGNYFLEKLLELSPNF